MRMRIRNLYNLMNYQTFPLADFHLLFNILLIVLFSLVHCGSPWLVNSRSLRKLIVSLIIEALSSCEVIAAGNGSNLANS